jgi:hypothetical protein
MISVVKYNKIHKVFVFWNMVLETEVVHVPGCGISKYSLDRYDRHTHTHTHTHTKGQDMQPNTEGAHRNRPTLKKNL